MIPDTKINTSGRKTGLVSVVVPYYNEDPMLLMFWNVLRDVLSVNRCSAEIIWVNDGSTDESRAVVEKIVESSADGPFRFKCIDFSRNYGHEAAMIAGIDYAEGEAIICLDSDLQHPPECIPKMLDQYGNGYDIVNMVRTGREDHSFYQGWMSSFFYKTINLLSDYKIEKNASDFFLISADVASVLRTNFRERNRFLRGFIQIVGYDKTTLDFVAKARPHGKSKYSTRKLFHLAMSAISSFSRKPLYLALIISFIFMLISIAIAVYSVYQYLFGDKAPSGYTTIIVFMSICFTILYFLIGIISVYIGFNFEESKDRPIYIIKNVKKSSTAT